MKKIKLKGRVDTNHKLMAEVPTEVEPGEVDVILVLPHEEADAVGMEWPTGVSRDWAADWSDPREDIYTITDGEPVDESR